ncbi:unnamed protein product [Durusdinium trenchii]|uniref:Large ribosomal subunit protein uL24c n=1 Tax=Durusdinium trenchii TaxID=1381693 RepID=A0ABP0N5Z5_9DINO
MDDEQEELRLEKHFHQVRQHLATQLSYGELELSLFEAQELQRRCATAGVATPLLELFDEVLAQGGDDGDFNLEIEADNRAEVAACAGDYFALFRHFALAEGLYERNTWGHARCLAEVLPSRPEEEQEQRRFEALEVALRVVLALEVPVDAWAERQLCQALFLLENLSSSSAENSLQRAFERANQTPLNFLEFLEPFIDVAAAPVEAVLPDDRGLLGGCQTFSRNLHIALPVTGVRALLMRSQAFCHRHGESLIGHWRHCCHQELQTLQCLDGPSGSPLLAAASALASHCHFVGYCVPQGPPSADLSCKEAGAAWLLRALYEAPGCDPPGDLYEVAKKNRELETAIRRLSRSGEVNEELEIIKGLEHLRPGSSSQTVCADFYDATVYPPWHKGVECMGVLPVPIFEHLQRLCPGWAPSEAAMTRQGKRLLVAGCGSGHQVAVELKTYSDITELVAFDVSAQSVAVAQRKLKELLPEHMARVRFLVGDIMDLTLSHPLLSDGFDLVVCCGVLHHLPKPLEGLQRLASVLRPSGVIQLATYSALSHQTWQNGVQDWLRSKNLKPESGIPTRQEVRAMRAEVLKPEERPEEALTLLHFPEFYTYAGVLDLLFHPLERSFTLLQLLEELILPARLKPLGVFFLDVNADLAARRAFRARFGEADMSDLDQWHALEVSDPDLFGRMHGLFLTCDQGLPLEPPAKRRRDAERKQQRRRVTLVEAEFITSFADSIVMPAASGHAIHFRDLGEMGVMVGDRVRVLYGTEKGKYGVISRILHDKNQVVVNGTNLKRSFWHPEPGPGKPSRVTVELPIHVTNVALIDPVTKQPTRVKRRYTMNGEGVRISKVSGCAMPEPVPVRPNERELLWKKHEETVLLQSKDRRGPPKEDIFGNKEHFKSLVRLVRERRAVQQLRAEAEE